MTNNNYISENKLNQIINESINNYFIEEGFMNKLGQGVAKVTNAYNKISDTFKSIKDAYKMGQSKANGTNYTPTSSGYLKKSLQDLYNICNTIISNNFYKGDGVNNVLDAINKLSTIIGGQQMQNNNNSQEYMRGRYGNNAINEGKKSRMKKGKTYNNNVSNIHFKPVTPPTNQNDQNTNQPINTNSIQGCLKVIKEFYNNARVVYMSNPNNRNFGTLLNKLYSTNEIVLKNLNAYYKTDFNAYSDTDRLIQAIGQLNQKK